MTSIIVCYIAIVVITIPYIDYLGEVIHALSTNASIQAKRKTTSSSATCPTTTTYSTSSCSIPPFTPTPSPAPTTCFTPTLSSPFHNNAHNVSPGPVATTTTVAGELLHVPYYNSKLTYLLKDSLGGNSLTVMLATVASESDQYYQSIYSLTHAARAVHVRNIIRLNRIEFDETDDMRNQQYYLNLTDESNIIM